jgi:heterotetrameric sarcosine oxidase gamma subunit
VPEYLSIETRTQLGIASVIARKGIDPATIESALATHSRAAKTHPLAMLAVGPGAWLAVQEFAEPDFAEQLQAELKAQAAVCDQSSAYAVLRLSGREARTVLQRGASIDVHPEVFRAGSVAVTVIAHIGVIIAQIDDVPTYDLFVFRSFAGSFKHWLDETVSAL